MPFPKSGEKMPSASKALEQLDNQEQQARTETEQEQADAANSDLREACRQYYWPHRSYTGPVADKIKWLETLDYSKRDAVLVSHGQQTQAAEKTRRQQLQELGVTK